MDACSCDQRPKICSVLGNDHHILVNTAPKDLVIRHSSPAEIKRVLGNMITRRIKFACEPRRQTLVDEQVHRQTPAQATFRQERPLGRPGIGWVLANSSAASKASLAISGLFLKQVIECLAILYASKHRINGNPRSFDNRSATNNIAFGFNILITSGLVARGSFNAHFGRCAQNRIVPRENSIDSGSSGFCELRLSRIASLKRTGRSNRRAFSSAEK